jgi:phasin
MTEKAKVEMPKFEIPNVAVPEAMREFAEKGVQQARDTYAKFKSAAEETTDRLEDSYASAAKGATEFNTRALEAVRENVNAAFDYTQQLLAVKSLTEAFELSSSHMKKQFETLSVQAKDLTAVAQKVAADAVEPIKAGVAKSMSVQ